MSLFDWAKKKGSEITGGMKKFANKDFMETIAAGCALVAAADGSIGTEEKQKMVAFIGVSEDLKVFKANQVIDRFNHYANQFEFDYNVGKLEAMKQIDKMKNSTEESRVLIAVCIAIGNSDSNFDKSEIAIIREMCQRLGIDSREFNL